MTFYAASMKESCDLVKHVTYKKTLTGQVSKKNKEKFYQEVCHGDSS